MNIVLFLIVLGLTFILGNLVTKLYLRHTLSSGAAKLRASCPEKLLETLTEHPHADDRVLRTIFGHSAVNNAFTILQQKKLVCKDGDREVTGFYEGGKLLRVQVNPYPHWQKHVFLTSTEYI